MRRRRKVVSVKVGDLDVGRKRITEPLTGCCIAKDFPSNEAAAAAARAMNEVADWPGVIKARAENRPLNCQPELAAIALAYGGKLAEGGGDLTTDACVRVAKTL